jgi:molybdate transport repressor ModE-like protein
MQKYAYMRRLHATIGWRLSGRAGEALDPRVVDLVALAAEHGSLAAAARAAGLPYRTAWALVAGAERTLGQRLLLLERGVGARPAALGRRILEARAEAQRVIAAQRDVLDVPLGHEHAPHDRAGLRIAASHDLVLAQLRDAWARRHGIAIAFHGSAEAIDLYLAGRADLAGFHVANSGSDPGFAQGEAAAGKPGSDPRQATPWSDPLDPMDPLLARLDPARDAVLPFVVRTQGLILPRGNPAGVRSLADVAAKRLRFVNRQPGSGTRIALERLVAREGIEPAAIAGWTHEEFTHAAVAATIAAGEAEAGFGIRAAAAQLGLAFVPLVDERYAFACRRRELADPRIRAFRRLIASPAVAKVVAPLPGYRLAVR